VSDFRNAAVELIRLGIWNHRVQTAMSREATLPVYQLECLLVLHLDQPTSAGSLAERLGIHKTSLSKLLGALQERGLVQRALGETDRRTEHVTLTEAGLAVVERAELRAEEIAIALLEMLPEERRTQFMGCVRTITSNDVPLGTEPASSMKEPSHESLKK